jgi:hypothetical protein
MEVALRRRLEGVSDISISQREQTAEVTFGEGDYAFSPEEFRKAVSEAGVVVLSFTVDACGSVRQNGQQRWLVAGKNRWLLKDDAAIPLEQPLCVSGRLDDRAKPPTLDVLEIRSASE